MPAFVQEKLGFIQIFLVSCRQVKPCQSHLGNLMSGYAHQLSFVRADFAAHAVGITDGDVQEVALPCGLVMCHGAFHHVAKVVELMAQFLHFLPTFSTCPFVGVAGIHRAGGVEVTVRLLRGGHKLQHAVDIRLQLLVGVSLQQITCPFDGLIHVRVVKRQASHFVFLAGMGRFDEVLITPGLLAFAESQRDCHFSARLEPLPPKPVGHLHRSERHR